MRTLMYAVKQVGGFLLLILMFIWVGAGATSVALGLLLIGAWFDQYEFRYAMTYSGMFLAWCLLWGISMVIICKDNRTKEEIEQEEKEEVGNIGRMTHGLSAPVSSSDDESDGRFWPFGDGGGMA